MLIAIAVLSFVAITLPAQENEPEQPPTNLEVIQRLAGEITDSVMTYLKPGDSLFITVRPTDSAWFLEGAILRSVIAGGRTPTTLNPVFEVELGFIEARIDYENIHRDGMFGSRIADRTVKLQLSTMVTERHSGATLLNESIIRTVTDVVKVSEVESLENPSIPATHGSLAKEGFFANVLEPLAALGAVAVAVYLLFHVRS